MADELTEDERRELEELRAARNERDNEEKAAEEKQSSLPNTHWLNLANGETVEAKGVMSHVDDIPVLHATEIPAKHRSDYQENQAESAHQF
jgi:cytochrome c-type biogenesis protein CcmE